MYIRVPREKVAPVDTGRTEMVQHHVSQSAGPQNAVPVLQSVPVQLPAPASQQWLGDSSTISFARVSVLQPDGSGDTSVDTVHTEPRLEALMQHVAGRIAVSGASAAAEVKVPVDYGSGITAMSEELIEALRRQLGVMQTALTQAFVGNARVVTSLGHECNIVTQSCPLQLSIETLWGPVRFTIPFIVLPGGGDVVIIGQKSLREKLGIDLMAQLKVSVLKAHGREDGPEMETTAGAVGEPNAGAVLRAAMAVTAFGPGGDAPGDVDDDVTLALLSQLPMMFKAAEVEMQDRVGALETAVDDAVDHGFRPGCDKMLRDIVFRGFRMHRDVFRPTLLGDPPAHVEPMTCLLYTSPSPRDRRQSRMPSSA